MARLSRPVKREESSDSTPQGSTSNVYVAGAFWNNHRIASSLATQPTKGSSWLHLPTESFARELLWLSGMVLLFTGIVSCFLCFYIFTDKGQTYYLDLGAIAAFTTVILGLLALRASHWEWFPSNISVTGFLFLCCLNLVQCCVLSIMAIHWYPYKLIEEANITTGFICALSFLILFLSILGLSVSGCWKNPQSDRRDAIVV